MKNIFNYFFLCAYSLLFILTPLFIYHKTSEIFEFNKMLTIYALTVIIIAVWVVKMILYKKIIIQRTPLDIPILLFLGSQVLSTFYSIDPHTSFFGYYGRFNGGLLSTVAYVLLYYGFISNISKALLDRYSPVKIFLPMLATTTVVLLWGLPGRWGSDLSCLLFTGVAGNECWTDQFRPAERMFSTLGQPNWLGAYVAVALVIGFYLLYRYRAHMVRYSWRLITSYLFTSFAFLGILFTRSRSALLAVLLCASAVFCYAIFRGKGNIRKRVVSSKHMIFMGVIMLGLVVIFKTGIPTIDNLIMLKSKSEQTEQTLLITEDDIVSANAVTESFDIRAIVWRGAVDLAQRHPILGTGVETFAYGYYSVRPVSHNLTSEWNYLYNRAHNEFLNIWATTGTVGLATYLLFIFSVYFVALAYVRKHSNDKHKHLADLVFFLTLAWSSIHITNFFGFATTTLSLYFYLIPAYIVKRTEVENKDDLIDMPVMTLSSPRIYAVLVSGICAIFALIYIVQYHRADVKYNLGSQIGNAGEYAQGASLIQEAIEIREEHVYKDKLAYILAQLAVVFDSEENKHIRESGATVSDIAGMAKVYIENAIAESPKNVLYYKTASKVYFLMYQIEGKQEYLEKAMDSLATATKLAPTDPKLPYSEALFYSFFYDGEQDPVDKNEYREKALLGAERSIELKKNYRDAYILKARLLEKFSRRADAESVLRFYQEEIDPSDTAILQELHYQK